MSSCCRYSSVSFSALISTHSRPQPGALVDCYPVLLCTVTRRRACFRRRLASRLCALKADWDVLDVFKPGRRGRPQGDFAAHVRGIEAWADEATSRRRQMSFVDSICRCPSRFQNVREF
ncbi:hypothetical protein BDZ89DRAFT_1160462 [Hymenopellis radicata]|nr:hypothetical protein BDZ89DRAFT_1160462 [Hymenopellis radicata]